MSGSLVSSPMLPRQKCATSLLPITSVQAQQFHAVTHSFAQRRDAISSILSSFRTLSVATGVGTPLLFCSTPERAARFAGRVLVCAALFTAALFASLNVAHADTEYYRHTLFDNSLTQDAYFYSSGKASAPSSLELVNGKLPVETQTFYTPPNALRLKWQSAQGGGWDAEVSVVNFRNREIRPADHPLAGYWRRFFRAAQARGVQRRNSRRPLDPYKDSAWPVFLCFDSRVRAPPPAKHRVQPGQRRRRAAYFDHR